MSSTVTKTYDTAKRGAVCVCLTGLFAIALGVSFDSLFVGMTVACCGFALCLMATKLVGSPKITVLAGMSFVAGILVATIIYFGYIGDYGVPYWVTGRDDMMLEDDAKQCVAKDYYTVYDMVDGTTSRERQHNTKGYVIFLSYLMRIGETFGGYHTMAPRIINIFLLNTIALLIVRLFLENHKGKQGVACSLFSLIALFPNSLYIASHVYRDVMSAFFLIVVYYLFNKKWRADRTVLFSCITVLVLFCAYWVRESLLIFLVGIILVSVFFKLPKRTYRRQIRAVSLAVAIVCIAAAVLALVQFGDMIIYYLTRYTERLSSSESGIVAAIYSLPLLPFGMPARFVAYLITPFYYGTVFNIGEWFSSTYAICNVVISFGTVYLVSQYYYLAIGWLADRKAAATAFLLVTGIALTTFGYRHVVMVYPFLFLAIAEAKMALDAFDNRRRFKQPVVIGCLFMAFFGVLFVV